jgi:hypothetical protein
MRLPLACSVIVVLSAAAAVPAMEESNLHSEYLGGYRFGVGVAPGVNHHEAKDSRDAAGTPDPAQNQDVSLSAKGGLDLYGGMFFNTALDGGIGVAVTPTIFYRDVRGKGTSGGVEVRDEFKAWGARLGIGPAAAWGPLALEITPFIGVGQGWMETEYVAGGVSARRGSGANVMLDYGITANAYWLFSSNFYVGASAGFDGFRCGLDSAAKGALDSQKITVKGDGLIANVIFGFWF